MRYRLFNEWYRKSSVIAARRSQGHYKGSWRVPGMFQRDSRAFQRVSWAFQGETNWSQNHEVSNAFKRSSQGRVRSVSGKFRGYKKILGACQGGSRVSQECFTWSQERFKRLLGSLRDVSLGIPRNNCLLLAFSGMSETFWKGSKCW